MGEIPNILKDGFQRSVLLMAVSAAALVLSYAGITPVERFDMAWVAIVLCGFPIIWGAVKGLAIDHDIRAGVLVSMAIIAALCLQEYFAAGEVALIMQIGDCLEQFSSKRARKGIERLVDMSPKTGRVVEGDEEIVIPVESIPVGAVIRVLPGESVPLDGRIVSGSTSIDQSVMTGESIPVDKTVGDEVCSGTINQMGAFDMEVVRGNEDSSFQRMAAMVASADAGRTRVVRIADRWATRLVAVVMVLVLATYLLTWDIYRAVTIMIVFCPCAFILATPTAVVAAIGNLTRYGLLVKDGDSLERMAEVDTVAFDKTGTVTEGEPSVVDVLPEGDRDGFLSVLASAESRSEHPLGRAIVAFARSEGVRVSDPEGFAMKVGRGVEALVDGKRVLAGNIPMMEEASVHVPPSAVERAEALYGRGCTSVYVSVDGKFAGMVSLSDTIRDGSRRTVSELSDMGVGCVLLTGDNPRAASFIASAAGIGEYRAECTPEGKMGEIASLQDAGRKVMMVGDGVNDAPALKTAWVGMAMGGTGTDIAVDAADIALVGDRLENIPHTVDLSRRMVGRIRFNIAFSLVWNAFAVGLSMMAVIGPVEGALVHNVGSVFVVANSALLLVHGRGREGLIRVDEPQSRPSSG